MAKKDSKNQRKGAPAAEPAPQPEVQKPQAVPKPAPKQKAAPAYPKDRPPKGWELDARIRYGLLGVILFLLLSLQGGGNDVAVGAGMGVLAILLSIGRMPLWSLRHRLSIPVLAVTAYALLNAAAGLYTRFGGFAASEFGKILAAFGVFTVVVLRAREGEAKPLSAMLAGVTAALGLVSVDASSWKVVSGVFIRAMDGLGCNYAGMNTGYEAGVRMTGVFGNANILAGILALGVFLSLYLLFTAKTGRSALGAAMLLGINSTAFLLAFSMGAIAMFAVAALLYLLFAGKGERIPLFLLMVETALVVLAMTFLAFTGLGGTGGRAALSVLALPLCGAILWALHWYGGRRAATALNRHAKAAGITVAALAAALCLYVVLGYHLTGGYGLAPGETLRRSVYPGPGAYTLSGDWSGAVNVKVESQNGAQTITHASTVLYAGALEGAAFTVPEDAKVVYVNLTAPNGAGLEELSLSSGEKIPLGYKLFPGFIANRIQGLWANQNAIQRVTFWEDGLKIYAKSPLIGNGLGSVEGLVTSVQSFYYESRYVHNHYVQVLTEMGIPGLLCFLAVLGSCAVTLYRRRREEEEHDPLLPALAACLAMTALHGFTEAVWSIGEYQTAALMVAAMIAVYFGRPVARLCTKTAAWAGSAALWVFCAVFSWFLYGNLSAERTYSEVKAGVRSQTPYTMTELAKKDRYNWAQYKLDMAVNAVGSEVPEFAETAVEYAAQVRKLGIYSINNSLEKYHYRDLGQYDELFAASREGIRQAASKAEAWQGEFDLYEDLAGDGFILENVQWYCDQVLEMYGQFQSFNEGRLEQLRLTDANLAFLERVRAVKDSGATGDAAAEMLLG